MTTRIQHMVDTIHTHDESKHTCICLKQTSNGHLGYMMRKSTEAVHLTGRESLLTCTHVWSRNIFPS